MSLFCSVLFYNSLKHAEFYFVLILILNFLHFFHFSSFPQAFHSIAKCVAALAMSCLSDGESVVNQFVRDIQVKMSFNVKCQIYTFVIILPLINKYYSMCFFFYPQSEKVADPLRLFSLLSLGEIGRHMYVGRKLFFV